jgi:hypothetical protein
LGNALRILNYDTERYRENDIIEVYALSCNDEKAYFAIRGMHENDIIEYIDINVDDIESWFGERDELDMLYAKYETGTRQEIFNAYRCRRNKIVKLMLSLATISLASILVSALFKSKAGLLTSLVIASFVVVMSIVLSRFTSDEAIMKDEKVKSKVKSLHSDLMLDVRNFERQLYY